MLPKEIKIPPTVVCNIVYVVLNTPVDPLGLHVNIQQGHETI
jgi:hypothetical protein